MWELYGSSGGFLLWYENQKVKFWPFPTVQCRPVENEQNLTKIIWYNILSMAVRVGTVAAVGKKGNNTIGN